VDKATTTIAKGTATVKATVKNAPLVTIVLTVALLPVRGIVVVLVPKVVLPVQGVVPEVVLPVPALVHHRVRKHAFTVVMSHV
jgi:hypothetical protein